VIPLGDSEDFGKGKEEASKSGLWTPDGVGPATEESKASSADIEGGGPEGMSEEELRRRIEEAMEKITVSDLVVDMMVSLSSMAYQRMGIPHEVNEKFRDMDQARLAIDCLDALLKALEGRAPSEILEPLDSTLSNLKLNFAKES
jgi:Domain of unknown function (DUF1844)